MPIPANYAEFMFLPASTVLVPKIFSNIHGHSNLFFILMPTDCDCEADLTVIEAVSLERLFVLCLKTPLTHGKISVTEWLVTFIKRRHQCAIKSYIF